MILVLFNRPYIIFHHSVVGQNSIIRFTYIPTEDMPADLLTTPMTRDRHQALVGRLGMASRSSGSVAA
jgi:hypothetical protein